MSKGNTHENDYLKLILHGTTIANLADNAASSPATELYLALHTADPGEGGSQAVSECTYTPYSRVAVPRSSLGFSILDNVASLASVKSFPQCTSGTETATHFSLGMAVSGTSNILWSGGISPNIAISIGVTPQLGIGTTITED